MELFIVFSIMILLFALGIKIYVSILASVTFYFIFLSNIPIEIAAQRIIGPAQSTSMMAIPIFILLGSLLDYTGISKRLLGLANVLVGRLRGGLALSNVLLSTMMGGLSASNLADAAMTTKMIVPEMERNGYKKGFAVAVTAASSLITPIIPPGIALIIYALLANVSIGSMFVAGIIPGLLGAVLMMLASYLYAVKEGIEPIKTTGSDRKGLLKSMIEAWPAVALMTLIIGGIRIGIFTPAEAGAVAVILTLIIGSLIFKEMSFKSLFVAVSDSAHSTATIMIVIMSSASLAWVFALEQAGYNLSIYISGLTDNPLVFLALVNVLFLFLGMLLEGTALMIIMVPLLLPSVIGFGIDPIHFGIVMIVNLSIGAITPPLGTVMLMVSNISNLSMKDFVKSSIPFYIALFILLILITYFPFISLFFV